MTTPTPKHYRGRAAPGIQKRPLHLCEHCKKWRTRRKDRCRECQQKFDAETLAMLPDLEAIKNLTLDC